MFRPQPMADAKVIQGIMRRLASCGVRAPSKVTVACIGGEVTLSGTIKHEHMRQPLHSGRPPIGRRSQRDRPLEQDCFDQSLLSVACNERSFVQWK